MIDTDRLLLGVCSSQSESIFWSSRHQTDYSQFSKCSNWPRPSRSTNRPSVWRSILVVFILQFFFFKLLGLDFFQVVVEQISPLLRSTTFSSVGFDRSARLFGLSCLPLTTIIHYYLSMIIDRQWHIVIFENISNDFII